MPPIPVNEAGIKQHANVSARGNRLIHRLDELSDDRTSGSFSISFQNLDRPAWLGSLVGVRAVDKLEHGVEGGRKMKAILMVRVTGSGMKANAEGQRTKRVPAYGVDPIVADSVADIEALLKNGPKEAKAAYKERAAGRERGAGRKAPRKLT